MAHKQDINDFNARVKRIKNPRNDSYFDPDLGMHIPKRVTRARIKKSAEQPSLLSSMLVSMIIGACGLMLGQAVRVRYFGLAADPTATLVADVLMALWFTMLISGLMRRRKIGARFSQIMGIAAMFVAGHNLVWRWPEQMSVIYTAEYVELVKETTVARSVMFHGTTIQF